MMFKQKDGLNTHNSIISDIEHTLYFIWRDFGGVYEVSEWSSGFGMVRECYWSVFACVFVWGHSHCLHDLRLRTQTQATLMRM